ncbi:uncharacterized protein BJ171DRAFT_427820 [Polychytrium aggregatum]|uniref:uncharacterized protein n=1 Tax=Polychytrium aggregatum TaxID=110093 RepID=UPI0022FDDF3E|nr:uncharacterized protein BJ171DRAFT_427820 [Polychytrium aggregatum]KAI9199280.1 hypothetical protein BJ171DRAFT_427820 [Polychytrium aggregatum]
MSSPALLSESALRGILQRVPGVWLLLTCGLALFGPFYAPTLFSSVFLILNGFFVCNTVRTAWGVYRVYRASRLHSSTNWYERYCRETSIDTKRADLVFEQIRHVIILPNYCEDIETLKETLSILASHSLARMQYQASVCLAMEGAEQGCLKKAEYLILKFHSSFREICYTMHPAMLPGEIRGKSSNVSWASRRMAEKFTEGTDHVIITIMDADTCFAEDYFTALTYHYAVAPKDRRDRMMFATSIIFDRNAGSVPLIVRTSDNIWATAVMSNLYEASSVKVPCSAYSVSMNLARRSGFWDPGPEAIGEDMHMFLKCFFATGGQLHVQPIYSPASQCNVQGASYLGTMFARYGQGKRHLWGSLDTGYTLRRAISWLLNQQQSSEELAHDKLKDPSHESLSMAKLLVLLHRVLEAHVLMTHTILMVFITTVTIPSGPKSIGSFVMPLLFDRSLHPYVEQSIAVAGWMRLVATVPFICTLVCFEKYHHWVGIARWQSDFINVHIQNGAPKLGKRPRLSSSRCFWNALEWIFLPICAVLYIIMPTIQAQISHFWTDSLDYCVASKPILTPQTSNHISIAMSAAVPDSPMLGLNKAVEPVWESTEPRGSVAPAPSTKKTDDCAIPQSLKGLHAQRN